MHFNCLRDHYETRKSPPVPQHLLRVGFMVVGGFLQTSAFHVAQMGIGRVLSGIGLRLQVATVPTWQSECAEPKTQGRWVMIEGGLQTTGVACGQWVGCAFFFTRGQIQ